MKNNRKWIFLLGIVAFGAAFLLLDFRAAASSTKAESNISTSSIGEGLPYAMQQKEKITLAVTGESPLAGALQKALAAELRQAGLGEVELVQKPETTYPNPVLLVRVDQPGVVWTPFYGTSQFTLKADYTSHGAIPTLSEKPVVLNNTNGPMLHMYAEYKVMDRSWGILSRPGYDHELADWMAKTIVETMRKQYEPKL